MADPEYLRNVRSWCDDQGLLLILDEIQTGIGRTGTLFAYEQYGIEPDIITLAKGLGGGVPIGAFLAKEQASVFAPGDHGSTFGGNPLVCATALATMKYILDNDLPSKVRKSGLHLIEQLDTLKGQFSLVTEVRGLGLLAAIEFNGDFAEALTAKCLDKGLLVNKVKPNALRFMPPLIVTEEEIDCAIEILADALGDIQEQRSE
jgi:acetylornithine/N-succinyldiaminopimelate aminotransferase